MLALDIFRNILKYQFSLVDIFRLAKISKQIYSLLDDRFLGKLHRKIFINRLNKVGIPGKEFIKLLSKNNAMVSGSFLIDVVLGEEWDNFDIDIYIEASKCEILEYIIKFLDKLEYTNTKHTSSLSVNHSPIRFIIEFVKNNSMIRIFGIDGELKDNIIDTGLSIDTIIFDTENIKIPLSIFRKEIIVKNYLPTQLSQIEKAGCQLIKYIKRGFKIKNFTEYHCEYILFYFLREKCIFTISDNIVIQIFKIFNWNIFYLDNNIYQIGIKTGPNNAFICVKKCNSLDDAMRYESPKIDSTDTSNINKIFIGSDTGIVNCIKKTAKKYFDLFDPI